MLLVIFDNIPWGRNITRTGIHFIKLNASPAKNTKLPGYLVRNYPACLGLVIAKFNVFLIISFPSSHLCVSGYTIYSFVFEYVSLLIRTLNLRNQIGLDSEWNHVLFLLLLDI